MAFNFSRGLATSAAALMLFASVSATADSSLARRDRKFIEAAVIGGTTEVDLGTLAKERASSDDVKKFGAQMVEDHTKAGDELKAIATRKNAELPPVPDKSEKKAIDRLSKLSGPSFDREFMHQMVDDHEKVIAAFDKASQGSKDYELKSFATRTLPTLQAHLQMAKSLSDALDKSPRGGSEATATMPMAAPSSVTGMH